MAFPHTRNATLLMSFVVVLVLGSLLIFRDQTMLRVWTESMTALHKKSQPTRVYHGSTESEESPQAVTSSEEACTSRAVNVTMMRSPPPEGLEGGTGARVVLFSTWVSRPHKRVIHSNVLRTWPLISPSSFTCLLFSDEEEEHQRAKSCGWVTLPFPRTACGGIPIFREMFLAAMRTAPAAHLFGFVNGDLLLGSTLENTLQSILENPAIMSKPLLLLLRRLNVPFDVEVHVKDLQTVETLKSQGKPMADGSSDAFFTNRLFPWQHVPDIVPGRLGIGMWLVLAARALNVTVIDLSATVTTLHMTSSAGNSESHSHSNSMCNHQLYRDLGVEPSSWGCGFIQCADSQSEFKIDSDVLRVHIQSKAQAKIALPNYCQNCLLNTKNLLSTGSSSNSSTR